MSNLICAACGEECEAQIMDFGIGAYDYGSIQGNDIREEIVSTCCEDLVYKIKYGIKKTYTQKDWDEDHFNEPDPPCYCY